MLVQSNFITHSSLSLNEHKIYFVEITFEVYIKKSHSDNLKLLGLKREDKISLKSPIIGFLLKLARTGNSVSHTFMQGMHTTSKVMV